MKRREFIGLLGGVATAWSLVARAQEKAMPVIGFLSSGTRAQGFVKGLYEAGYFSGQNVEIEYQLAQGDYAQLPGMATALVDHKVDLIVALGPPAAHAAKASTSTIPVVFTSGDPIAEGLVASLARPGGNLTGISINTAELMPKRLELVSELVPRVKNVAVLVDPAASNAEGMIREAQGAAQVKGVAFHILNAGSTNDDEIDAAFAALRQLQVGALIVGTDFNIVRLPYLVALASRYAVPTIFPWSEFAWAGGLLSYGPNLETAFRQMGVYAARILKGEKPADLPVEQPTKFELVINLKTAKALGLTVPQALLARADEVIE